MKLLNFVLWLSVGAVIGWFASRIAQERKSTPRITADEIVDPEDE